MRYIHKIGVEMEGGWNESYTRDSHPRLIEQPPAGLYGDSSVSINARYYGEINSKPEGNLDTLFTWIKYRHPQIVNETCGLHVHLSFKSIHAYARLMSPKFFEYFSNRIEQWGKRANAPDVFWSRFNGDNMSYCAKEFFPEAQISGGATRYTQLNYCWNERPTIEVRLMPMFQQYRMIKSSILAIVDSFDSFLIENKPIDKDNRIYRLSA